MKNSLFITIVGCGAIVLFGAGCSAKKPAEIIPQTPSAGVSTPTDVASQASDDVPAPLANDEVKDLYQRVEALQPESMMNATSSDAINGPLKWKPNGNFTVAVASEPIATWIDPTSIASPDNYCIGEEFQKPDVFQQKILSRFTSDDRAYLYYFTPDPKENSSTTYDSWDITVIPNRFGYTTEEQIDRAFAWVGGCEAGRVGLFGFNERWIAYGDGCHESGGPSPAVGCHMAIEALAKSIELR